MLYHQRGFVPRTTMILGILIPSIFLMRGAIFFIPLYIHSIDEQTFSMVINKIIDLTIHILLYLTVPFYLGIFLSGLFPVLHLSNHGLQIMYFGGIIRKRISWKEIEMVKKLNGGYHAIVLKIIGMPLLRGLHFNELYGRIVRCYSPVILLSPEIEDKDALIKQIKEKSGYPI
jgi:hypothetical protein